MLPRTPATGAESGSASIHENKNITHFVQELSNKKRRLDCLPFFYLVEDIVLLHRLSDSLLCHVYVLLCRVNPLVA